MQLWTWQTAGFDLTSGSVEHDRSEYVVQTKGIREAYVKLSEQIGTNQIVWCCIREEDSREWQNLDKWKPISDRRVLWRLDVPSDQILRIVDAFIWNRFVDEFSPSPMSKSMRSYPKWITQNCRDRFPFDPGKWDPCAEERQREYDIRPSAGWLSRLFLGLEFTRLDAKQLATLPDAEGASALIGHPIRSEWVVERPVPTIHQK